MVPKWELVTLKWEGSIRKREVEVTAPTRPAGNSKARKNQGNADAEAVSVKRGSSSVAVAAAASSRTLSESSAAIPVARSRVGTHVLHLKFGLSRKSVAADVDRGHRAKPMSSK
jgi:hypothetical protein